MSLEKTAILGNYDGKSAWGALFALLVLAVGGCGSASGAVGGVLLEGDPSSSAVDALYDFDTGQGVPASEISTDSFGTRVARTEFEVELSDDATVGEVNALLESIDGLIVSMLAGPPFVVIQIPDPGSLDALDALFAEVRTDSVVLDVYRGNFDEPDMLPDNVSENDTESVNPHLALRASAAWNAKAALRSEAASQPLVLVSDGFGDGPPGNRFDVEVLHDTDFARGNPHVHGYFVLSVIAAQFGGADSVTGIFPGTTRLRAVDNRFLPAIRVQNRSIEVIKEAGGNVVLNTSFSGHWCGKSNVIEGRCNADEAQREALKWIKKVRDANAEELFLHVTSAGNTKVADTDTDARVTSAAAAAGLLPLVDPRTNETVENLSNTVVIENRHWVADGSSIVPSCLTGGVDGSKTGGDFAAIGARLWGYTSARGGQQFASKGGTSASTPQVTGLAAYLWALAPDLSPQELIILLDNTSREVFTPAPDLLCNDASGARVVDAYASLLSLDSHIANEDGELPDAPVRLALLDANDDGLFLEDDLEQFHRAYFGSLDERTPLRPTVRDYGRFDLNGDGATGGIEVRRFDLDLEGSGRLGPALLSSVTAMIEDTEVTFNEFALSDLQILCYYAYSPLYQGGSVAREELLGVQDCRDVTDEIAFESNRDGNQEIYVMRADGSNPRRLTQHPGTDTKPSWSPDKLRIAFDTDRDGNNEIYAMDFDGTNLENLTRNGATDRHPSWSPDGTKIAFTSDRGGNEDIYVMNADGSRLQRLTNHPENDTKPAWSPDGTKIVFRSFRDGDNDIYVMSANGSGVTNLTRNDASDRHPVWSPDGTRIAFGSDRNDGTLQIYVMNPNGSGVQRLTNSGADESKPSWSPDSSQVAFESRRDGQVEIYVIGADGTGLQNLTNAFSDDREPSWSAR